MKFKEWMNKMAELAANNTMQEAYTRGMKKLLKRIADESSNKVLV